MTKQDFLKNNRGIDDGKDLPLELLESIFDEIQSNEIVMKDEKKTVLQSKALSSDKLQDPKNVVQQFADATEDIAQKSEALLKKGIGKGGNFIVANHYQHIKPIFSLVWMSFLATLSTPLQASEDMDTIKTSLEGFKYCLYIAFFHWV